MKHTTQSRYRRIGPGGIRSLSLTVYVKGG